MSRKRNLHSLAWQYDLGCIFGAFIGGWLADRIGRINGLGIGACFALVGGALQAAMPSSSFILVARVVTGLGTGGSHLSPNIGKFSLACCSVRSSGETNFLFAALNLIWVPIVFFFCPET